MTLKSNESNESDAVIRDPRCGKSDFVACLINRLRTEDGSELSASVRCETCHVTVEGLDQEIQSLGCKLRNQQARAEFLGLQLFEQAEVKAAIVQLDGQPQSQVSREQLSADVGVYTLRECLSRGPLGTVYRATHRLLQKDVAVKLLVNDWTQETGTAFLLNHELRMAGKLDHPYLASITDAGTSDGYRYLAMEWIQGVNLETLIEHVGKLSVPNAVEIVRQAAIGMNAAHQKGLIHCDLKLGNLMLDCGLGGIGDQGDPRIRVMNLGLSRVFAAHQESSAKVSGREETHDTDHRNLEHRPSGKELQLADIRSLGHVLCRLITGKPSESLVLSLASDPNVSAALAALITRMVDCGIRYDSDQDTNDSGHALESMGSIAVALAAHSANHDLIAIAKVAREKSFFYSRFVDESHDRLSGSPNFGANPASKKAIMNAASVQKPVLGGAGDHENSVDKSVRSHRSGGSWRVLLGLASLSVPLILFGIWLLWSLTDGGYLRIRADPTIAGAFELVRDGSVVDSIELVAGVRNAPKWYDSGDYELRISSDESSSLRLNDAVFSLKRNQSHTVLIERSP